MNNLDRCIEYLNNGIEFKKQGKFEDALEQYKLARYEYPLYKHTYNNIAKILFSFENTHHDILTNLLTYAHLSMLMGGYNVESIDFAWENKFYDYHGFYLPNILMNGFTCRLKVQEEPYLGKVFADINLTFNTGLAYILEDHRFITHNNIPNDLIQNHVNLLSGKKPTGPILGDSEFAPLIRVIGFTFLLDNMVISNSAEFASNAYFRPDYRIDYIHR